MRLPLSALLATALLAGCNPVTQDNFARLKPGMPRAEVEALLGEPTECAGALGVSSCQWGDESRFISIQFAADQVLLFSGKGLK
ncbi:outer membrane protein assembly factor BamE [Stutzerimonas urumqiensis]|uniref:outer membrane protein assembly factor BamE domain-containing protein n=1 Tax=Stutzerimonas urumqiensis TaxID=638269 RepID=UPI000EB55563|nr:outer membrane protein assembly factor BamE [Stutzerimonas urumqiensis]